MNNKELSLDASKGDVIFYTGYRKFEANHIIDNWKGIFPENLDKIINHVCNEELSQSINYVMQKDGEIMLSLDNLNEWIKVTINE